MRLSASVLPFIVALLAGCAPEESTGESVGYNTELDQGDFFRHDKMYFVRIEGWDPARMTPQSLSEEQSHQGARLLIYRTNADSTSHCPDGEGELLYRSDAFTIRTSGNLTNGTPKSSYKLKLDGERFAKMKSLNLKSMWNDVSQMREALAWDLFDKADVPASRHAYARFCINDRYYGLYSIIEQVDKPMLKEHFDDLDEGNLYKAYWAADDLGPADLQYRSQSGNDGGRAYFRNSDPEQRTYQIKSNEDAATYDDLATLVRVLNGKTLQGTPDFNSAAFEEQIEAVFDVHGFLRWATVNNLLGAWDNYWGTPANYYVYNGGREGSDFNDKPYFTWIPWDYDNTFGIDFFGVPWQSVGIYDWAKHTRTPSRALPLVTNLLKNDKYLAYYLDHMECMIDKYFNPEWVEKQIGEENGTRGLWPLIRASVYLESDSPTGAAHTGRQFTNDQVYWNGLRHNELRQGSEFILGIWHHVKARGDSARSQIANLRTERHLTAATEPVCN